MKKIKPNITLASMANLKESGLWLGIRKGINELLRPKKETAQPQPMPKDTRPLAISIIICTTGTCRIFQASVLSALSQSMGAESYEVLVVWNRTDPPPAEEYPKEIRWISEPRQGLSYARNTGAEQARGRVLLYLDDDAVAPKQLAEVMARTFLKHRYAAIVGGQIFTVIPNPRPAAVLPGQEGLWSAYRVPYRHYRTVREQYAFPYGACFAVRHSVLEKLGGFPESYGRVGKNYAGGEETALCFLALNRGWKIGIQPKAWVEHRVDPKRFSKEHVRETLRAGIFTTYRLYLEGYAPRGWDRRYVKERIRVADRELKRLDRCGSEMECYYKKCERDAFAELYFTMKDG